MNFVQIFVFFCLNKGVFIFNKKRKKWWTLFFFKKNLYIDINNVIRHDVFYVLSFRSEISWQALKTLIHRQKSGPLVLV